MTATTSGEQSTAAPLLHDGLEPHGRCDPAAGRHMSPDFVPGLVSVIVPTYNRRHLVLETLDSVIAQTYRPIQLIVVDDGSTDGTAETVGAWFQNLEAARAAGLELQLIRQENAGAPRARNRGLAACRGEFIQFLDSDDLLNPRKLEMHAARLRAEPNVQYVYSLLTRFTSIPDWNAPANKPPASRLDVHDLLASHWLNTAVGLYRRSVCVAIGSWNEALPVSQDMEYNLRLMLATRETAFVNGTAVAHRRHRGERVSTGPAAARLHSLAAIESLLSAAGRLDRRVLSALAVRYFRIGLAAASKGDTQSARKAARRGLSCPCALSRRIKLNILAVLTAKVIPGAVQRVVANQMMAFATRKLE